MSRTFGKLDIRTQQIINSSHYFIVGSAPGVAIQHGLGLLSERRSGNGAAHCVDIGPVG